jgi:hypothetical protein
MPLIPFSLTSFAFAATAASIVYTVLSLIIKITHPTILTYPWKAAEHARDRQQDKHCGAVR